MRTTKVILGTLAGLCIGAVAGILLAPEKGLNTRKQIYGNSGDYVDELKAKLIKFWNFLTEQMETTKTEVEEFAYKGKSKFDEGKKGVKNAALEVKNSTSDNF